MASEQSNFPISVPETVVVLGGNWESSGNSEARISREACMRVLAVGVLAKSGAVKNLIFSGGLKAKDGTTEDEALKDYFQKMFPGLEGVNILQDPDCHDTGTSAESVRKLLGQHELEGPYGLLTSMSHQSRAKKAFRRKGVEVVSLPAEPIFARLSPVHRREAERYLHSPRYGKRLIAEAALRSLTVVDKDYRFIQRVASRLRPNRSTA